MPTFVGMRQTIGILNVPRSLPTVRALREAVPIFPLPYTISGVTKDAAGVPVTGCSVVLYRTADDSIAARDISDDVTGAFRIDASSEITHYAVAYKSGSPDLAGVTVNTLSAIPD